MSRIAFVDGRYLPIDAPAVRVEDRGLQFADGVYEVIKCVADGRATSIGTSRGSSARSRP